MLVYGYNYLTNQFALIDIGDDGLGRTLGMWDGVDSFKKHVDDTINALQYAFEVIGDPGAFIQAWWSIGLGGRVIQVGITDKTVEIPLPMLIPLHQKAIIGTMFGDLPMEIHVPRLVDLAMKFDFKFDKLITNKFKLEQITDVMDKMLKRQILGRWVLQWD